MVRKLLFVLVLAASVMPVHKSGAVTPQRWFLSSAQDMESGDVEGLSVADDGTLSLAPVLEDVGETEEMFVWALAEDRQGRLFAATGNQGRVFIKEGTQTPRLFFETPQTQIQSLVIDPQGNVYAGAAPDGVIYKILPDGRGNVFCRTGETYVWDMELGADGSLYAATGTRGIVLKIDRDGKIVDKVLDTSDPHVMTLVPDGRGGFYAGTDGNGLVYAIENDRSRLLFAAAEREIHTLAVGPDGRVYAGATGARNPGEQSTERSPSGAVYRLEPSGAATKLWTAPYPLVLSIVPYDSSRMLVGVGPRGVLYLLSTDGRTQRVADTGESQPACFLKRSSGEILIGMGNSGKIKRLTTKPGTRGVFVTPARNAGYVAQWGRVEIRGVIPPGTRVHVESRTGNKSDPATEWSAWQPLFGEEQDRIQSPAAQYAQLRLTLTRVENAPSPQVSSIGITSLQVNLRPEISMVSVQPVRSTQTGSQSSSQQGESSSDQSSTPRTTTPRGAPTKRSLVSVRWNVTDPNGDDLVYSLYFRRVSETTWHLLDELLTRNSYVWDTEGAPEGMTVVKVVASDQPSNPWQTALSAERESAAFPVDYSGPVVSELTASPRPDGSVVLRGVGSDTVGPINDGAYSVNSGEWRPFFPVDGIFDGKREAFEVLTEALDPGTYTIAVRLRDSAENVGVGTVTVQIPRR